MIIGIVEELGAWTWWILGLVLLALEIFLPGTFFLWFGVAAIIIGTSALLFAWPWQIQLVGFVVLALCLVILGRRYFAQAPAEEPAAIGLNERGKRLIGISTVLAEPIVDGRGRIRVDDTTWRVVGPDLPSGRRVRVVGIEGTVLRVDSVEPT